MLPCALRAGHFILSEHICPLSGKYGVMICSGQCERHIFIDAQTVPAIFRLSVNSVPCDAKGCVTSYQRCVVSSGSIPSGHRRRDIVGAGVPGVNPVILEHKRLMSMLLRSESSRDFFAVGHRITALIVQAKRRQHDGAGLSSRLQCRRTLHLISAAARSLPPPTPFIIRGPRILSVVLMPL